VSETEFTELEQILFDMMKTVKVISVYPDNNPIPMKLKESFIYRFADFIRDNGDIKLKVDHNKLLLGGKIVFEDRSDEESLAKIFHNSGITEIQFTQRFETDEAHQFFKAIKSYTNRENGSEDLVALLWEADISGFEYQTLDDVYLQNYSESALSRESAYENPDDKDSLGDSGSVAFNSIFLDEDGETSAELDEQNEFDESRMGSSPSEKRPENIQLPDMANLLTDAYKISDDEQDIINGLVEENDNLDMFQATSELIREIIFQENEYNEFLETVTIADKIHSELIQCGKIRYAGEILSHLQDTKISKSDRSEQWHNAVNSSLVMAGGGEAISILGKSLNYFTEVSEEEIIDYLNHFDWQVLSSLVDLLGVLENQSHRVALCDYLAKNGKGHIDIIAKGVFDKRWFVVRNIVGVLIAIGGDKSFSYLSKAIDHEEPRVRINMAQCLSKYEDEKSIELSLKLMWDEDITVQKASLEAIGKLEGEVALKRLVSILGDERFDLLENASKKSIIMKFSEIGGAYAVGYLVSLIIKLKGGMKSNREFYRKVAFYALIVNDSEKAEEELQKLSKSWKKSIRQTIAYQKRLWQ